METPARHSFSLDGNTRVFPIPSNIKGDNYVRLEVDSVVINDRAKYDIVNNSIVFNSVADVPDGSQLDVLVVQSEEAIGALGTTTNMDIVAANITNVNTVGNNITDVNSVADNMAEVLTADTNAATATAQAAIATTQAGIATTQATTATTQATTATTQAGIATTKASEASTSASNALTSATNASTSETNANASASSASTSASNASASATTATTQAGVATTKASQASTSASNASASATSASTSAATATTKASNASASATSAATSATNAATSASNAASSASSASSSATTATTKASEATTSASNALASKTQAATSASSASSSASTATTQAGIATTKASEAATSETNAATSATSASASATNAATSASNAATSASSASTSASSASTSASNAATAATNAATSYDNFDDRYLGAKTSDPTVDNDGDALITGALYFNTTDDVMKVYEGSSWLAAFASLSGALIAANNLSDVNNVSASRTNLGLALGTDVQPYDATIVTDSDIGVTVQPYDVDTTKNDVSNTFTTDQTINGLTVGRGAGDVTSNTATGSNALAANTTGANNTAHGANALQLNTTGINHTAVGRLALQLNTTGNFNTALGVQALQNNTTGIGNTAIGTGAGLNLTTGSNNTIIGRINGTAGLSDTVIIGAGTTERMRIDSSGNVGIGTSSPTQRLTVQQNSDGAAVTPVVVRNFSLGTTGTEARLLLTTVSDEARGAYISAVKTAGTNSHALVLATNSTGAVPIERLRIDSSGDVGIGTTSPSSKLTVEGGSAIPFAFNGNGGSVYPADGFGGALTMNHSNGNGEVGFWNTWTGNTSRAFQFYHKTSASTKTELMTIATSGNVGIGTDSPTEKLDVNGTVKATSFVGDGASLTGLAAFPAGTRMAFQQTSAPTGWTKDTNGAIDDSVLRLVTGGVSSGGSTAFSSFNGQTTVGATTLSTAQIPSHTHTGGFLNGNGIATSTAKSNNTTARGSPTGATGGGGSHSHSLTTAIKYYDFIIATKD